jgi:hypothetical protein
LQHNFTFKTAQMKYTNLVFAIIISAALIGCGGSSSTANNTTENNVPVNPVTNKATVINDTAAKPAMPQATTLSATSSVTGLNPKHGQPGHRCDIAEGAPLTTAPTKPTVTPPQPVIIQQPIPMPAAAVTAPGMNPEHGKPGHRCDISVGAPLNSKPAAQATPATTPISTSIPQPTPIKPEATAITAPGMNPEHGKPGHRCEIAVGAPLNSKAVAK